MRRLISIKNLLKYNVYLLPRAFWLLLIVGLTVYYVIGLKNVFDNMAPLIGNAIGNL